jgi:hypothetical protein
MSFGFGKGICPSCYNGEDVFLFFDQSFWLNRLLGSVCQQISSEEDYRFPDWLFSCVENEIY